MFFRLGVPFFFVVSAYFLADKLFSVSEKNQKECQQSIKEYSLRMIPPLAFWGLIGLILDFIKFYSNGLGVAYLIKYSCQTVFYPQNAMWYLWASIIGAMILTFLYLKCKHWRVVWVIYACIAYIFVLLCNNYFFITEGTFLEPLIRLYSRVFMSARNGVFLAPVYMGMGFILRCDDVRTWLNKYKWTSLAGLICGFILLAIEASMLFGCTKYDDRGFFVSQLLLIPSLVSTSMLFDIKLQLPYRTLRRLSTSIYYMHATIKTVIAYFVNIFMLDAGPNILVFAITNVLSISIALITYRIKNKKLSLIIG